MIEELFASIGNVIEANANQTVNDITDVIADSIE